MTKTNKTVTTTLMAAMFAFGGLVPAVHADPVASNDSGQFIIRIFPNIDLGIVVDTVEAAWADGGSLDLTGATMDTAFVMFTGVTLQVVGNFDNQEVTLEAAGNNTWGLDTDATARADLLRLYAMAGEYQLTAPAQADFDGVGNLITTSPQAVGQAVGDETGNSNHIYELDEADAQYDDMDGMIVGTFRTLWLRADTPLSTTSDEIQRFTITVTAVSGTTN